MNHTEKYLGVLTRLNEKEHEGSTYLTSWVETPDGVKKFFHQNSLRDRKEINDISEGVFILFDVKKSKTKFGEREDVANCSLNCEKVILNEIIQYDEPTIRFIFKHSTEELKTKLVSRIEDLQLKTQSSEVLLKIENIRKAFPKKFQLSEIQSVDIKQNQQQGAPIVGEFTQKTFLETIFETNTPEYNQNLFLILIDGLKIINNEDIFQQAKFLLKFNNLTTSNKIENLNSICYHRATNEYKFRLWFEKLTDYCSTEILKFYFDKSDFDIKAKIIQRCQGDEIGFLVLNNQAKNRNEIEEVYFSNIREKLLQELNVAKKTILVAVAWFTNDDLFGMLCEKLEQGVKVELIIMNDYINNWEFGLPFQKFIDLGGKLYLSEYPSIMHHKFCIIDNETIFNGSYNWTYYAELHNDENIMLFKGRPNLVKEFNIEFKKLKLKLGDPIVIIEPFDSSQIVSFERVAFRQFFSTDLTLRAEKIQNANIMHANSLANTAIDIDSENTEAIIFQKQIEPEVKLQQRAAQVDHIVTVNDNSVIEGMDITKKTQGLSEHPENEKHIISKQEITNFEPHEKSKVNDISVLNITQQISSQSHNTTSIPKQEPVKQLFSTRIQSTPKTLINYTPSQAQIQRTGPIVYKNYSIPIQENNKKQFQKLKIAIALDVSSSMDNLYKNGIVQQGVRLQFDVYLPQKYKIWQHNTKKKQMAA